MSASKSFKACFSITPNFLLKRAETFVQPEHLLTKQYGSEPISFAPLKYNTRHFALYDIAKHPLLTYTQQRGFYTSHLSATNGVDTTAKGGCLKAISREVFTGWIVYIYKK